MAQKSKNKILRRVAIYGRVSSAEQAKFGDSIRDQIESCKDYINRNDDLVLQDTYIDDGISGQKLDRDEFSRLLANAQAGLIDLIIFTKLDRWFRNLRHYLNTQAILEKHDVSWIAIDQPYFDTSTPHGRAFVNQSMMWAELEAQNDSNRIIDVFNNKVKYGEVLSGKVPIGYSIVDKHLQPNEKAPIALAVFEHYQKYNSLHRTLRFLEQEYGIIMTLYNLRKSVLTNKKYIGVFRDNENYCPPIIPRELFDDVQYRLSLNVSYAQKNFYIFAGLLKCAECGYIMTATQIRVYSKKKYRYTYAGYSCKNSRMHPGACTSKSEVSEMSVERYLLANIKDDINAYIAQFELESAPVINNMAKKDNILKKINRLKDLYLNELITLDEYKLDKETLTEEYNTIPDMIEPPRDLSHLKNLLDQDIETIYTTLSPEEKREFWSSFVKEIHISKSINRTRTYTIIFL